MRVRWNFPVEQPAGTDVEPRILAGFEPNADRPIKQLEDDRLRRSQFARALGNQLGAAGEEGLVMALTGPWGSGKTSLLNLISDHTKELGAIVLRFNPWFFSGTEQLTGHFFTELGAQLSETTDDKLKKIGSRLKRYGGLLAPLKLVPVAGTYIEAAGKLAQTAGEALTADDVKSLWTQHEELVDELNEAKKRIVVMVDDIDRLDDAEIRQVMQLVRMVGDFPRVVYLLAFDLDRVVQVLSKGGLDGHKYLDKIVQISYEVPDAGRDQLLQLLMDEVDKVLDTVQEEDLVGADDLGDIVHRVVAPMVTTVRDIKRYVNVLPFAFAVVGAEIAHTDILALEAVRLFSPGLYEELLSAAPILTGPKVPEGEDGDRTWRGLMEGLQKAAEPHPAVVPEFVSLVFPIGQAAYSGSPLDEERLTALARERRVAVAERLRIYFEKALPGDVVPGSLVEGSIEAMSDPEYFGQLVANVPPTLLPDLFARLADFAPAAPKDNIAALCRTLLLSMIQGRDGDTGLDPAVDLAPLERLIGALFRKLEPVSERCAALEEVLESIDDLGSLLLVIQVVTNPDPDGSTLVDRDCAARLPHRLLEKVTRTDPSVLAHLPVLNAILDRIAKNDRTTSPRLMALLEDDEVYIQYLATAPRGWLSRRIPALVGDRATFSNRFSRIQPQLEQRTDVQARQALRNGVNILQRL
jgi:hypothetical protein